MARKIPNRYDDTQITEKTIRMANKVKLSYTGDVDIPTDSILIDYDHERWTTVLTFKGRTFESTYIVPVGLAETPRIEYVLNSLFCNSALHDKYANKIFEFINDFPGMFSNFQDATQLLKGLEHASKGIHNLFRDEYGIYKREFIKINNFDKMLEGKTQ